MAGESLLARGLVCSCLLAVLAGCDAVSSSSPGSTPTTSPQTATRESSTEQGEKQVLDAYRGMWEAYVDAARTSDYESPGLARYAAGQAHSSLVSGLYANHKRGVVVKGTPRLSPHVISMTPVDQPTQAEVTDCADDSQWRTYDSSGRPVGSKPAGQRRVESKLRLFGGAWKVTELVVGKERTC